MQKPTHHRLILSLEEMKSLIAAIERNKAFEPAMSNRIEIALCEDSDYNSLRIDRKKTGQQFSSYSECLSMNISLAE